MTTTKSHQNNNNNKPCGCHIVKCHKRDNWEKPNHFSVAGFSNRDMVSPAEHEDPDASWCFTFPCPMSFKNHVQLQELSTLQVQALKPCTDGWPHKAEITPSASRSPTVPQGLRAPTCLMTLLFRDTWVCGSHRFVFLFCFVLTWFCFCYCWWVFVSFWDRVSVSSASMISLKKKQPAGLHWAASQVLTIHPCISF